MAAAPASRFLYGGSRQWIMISRRSWRRSGSGWRICLSTKGAKWDAAPMGTSTKRGGKMGKSAGGGVGSPGLCRCGDPGGLGGSARDEAAWVAEGRPGADGESLVLPPPAGWSRPSKSHSAVPSGASVPPRVAAACLLLAVGPGGDRAWRWSLGVWSRGTRWRA